MYYIKVDPRDMDFYEDYSKKITNKQDKSNGNLYKYTEASSFTDKK